MNASSNPAALSTSLSRHERLARAGWWLTLAILLGLALGKGLHSRFTVDLSVYLLAAKRFLAGELLYQAADGTMPFKYAPAVAWLYVPFTLIPRPLAGVVWNLGSLLALVGTGALLFRAFAPPEGVPFIQGQLARAGATFALGQSFVLEMHYGQVDLLMLFLLTLAAERAEKEKPVAAGFAFAVAVLLKSPAAVFGLYFLMRKQWRVVLWTAAAMALLWVPVLGRFGLEGTLAQVSAWRDIMATTTLPWALQHNAQGFPTLLLSLVYPPRAIPTQQAMSWAQLVATGLFVVAIVWRRPEPRALFALCALATALLSPLAWRANFVLAWPLLVWMLASARGAELRRTWALAALLTVFSVVVHDWLWGMAILRSILFGRPFALAFAALFLLVLLGREAGARSPVEAGRALQPVQP